MACARLSAPNPQRHPNTSCHVYMLLLPSRISRDISAELILDNNLKSHGHGSPSFVFLSGRQGRTYCTNHAARIVWESGEAYVWGVPAWAVSFSYLTASRLMATFTGVVLLFLCAHSLRQRQLRMHACGEGGRRAIAGAAPARAWGCRKRTRRGPRPHVAFLTFPLSLGLSARGLSCLLLTCQLLGRASTVGGRGRLFCACTLPGIMCFWGTTTRAWLGRSDGCSC